MPLSPGSRQFCASASGVTKPHSRHARGPVKGILHSLLACGASMPCQTKGPRPPPRFWTDFQTYSVRCRVIRCVWPPCACRPRACRPRSGIRTGRIIQHIRSRARSLRLSVAISRRGCRKPPPSACWRSLIAPRRVGSDAAGPRPLARGFVRRVRGSAWRCPRTVASPGMPHL